MKSIIKLFVIVMMLQSFQCSKSDDKNSNYIAPEQLQTKKQEIINYINTFTCSEIVGCSSIAFGSKPCGGPREYLLFSNAINLPQLQQMVTTYNELDNQNNIQTNQASDCMFVSQPANVYCVNGVCSFIN